MNSQDSSHGSSSALHSSAGIMTADEKVLMDLSTLEKQVDACRALLSAPEMKKPEDVDGNDVLLAYVGFLEACVPRMEQLIEAALSSGALGESTVEKVLLMNDILNKTLEDCENPSKVTDAAPAPTAAAAAAAASAADANFDPFGVAGSSNESNFANLPGEVDPFVSLTSNQPAADTSASGDPFDLLGKEQSDK